METKNEKIQKQIDQMKLAQKSHAEGLSATMVEVRTRLATAPKVMTDDGQEALDVSQMAPAEQLLLSLAQLRSAVDVLGIAQCGSTLALLEAQLEPEMVLH